MLAAFISTLVLAPSMVQVRIDPSVTLSQVGKDSIGVAVAVWDAHMMDDAVPKLIRDVGAQVIRYPGGSYADLYQWKTSSSTKGERATIQEGTDFDSFMAMCKASKATPLITVNYGSNPEGTGGANPEYAAEWVKYANKKKKYGVKYWEIGNEVYGNGFYSGKGWEFDLHAPYPKDHMERLKDPRLGPNTYGKEVKQFCLKMKAVDKSVKIGAVLTVPGEWPEGGNPDWSTNVLAECGKEIDFVVLHWYPSGKSAEQNVRDLAKVEGFLTKTRSLVDKYCGERAKDIQIWMTEGDASGQNMRHPGSLFAADHFARWLKFGASHVNWWNVHNGLWVGNNGEYDDQGMLSSGHTSRGVSQPPANTPFPTYWGVAMFSRFAHSGDTFVKVDGSTDALALHAVKTKRGQIRLLAINHGKEAVDLDLGVYKLPNKMLAYGPSSKSLQSKKVGQNVVIDGETMVLLEIKEPK